jgi:anti-sigma regulatory factor (Ser/Thr protein kinase)
VTESTFFEDLPRSPLAPGIARRAVTSWFREALSRQELDTAKLLTSELVANAVVHGEGHIVLRAGLDDNRVLVEVIDEGQGFEHEARRRDFDELHGRGLAIVDSESSRWGLHEGTTHVWFELELAGPRLGADSKPAPPGDAGSTD